MAYDMLRAEGSSHSKGKTFLWVLHLASHKR